MSLSSLPFGSYFLFLNHHRDCNCPLIHILFSLSPLLPLLPHSRYSGRRPFKWPFECCSHCSFILLLAGCLPLPLLLLPLSPSVATISIGLLLSVSHTAVGAAAALGCCCCWCSCCFAIGRLCAVASIGWLPLPASVCCSVAHSRSGPARCQLLSVL